jgi:hypothetical protein
VGDAPEHLAPAARGNRRCKQCCRRAIDCTIATAGDLMQRAERQPSSRQPTVDFRYAERQDLARTAARTFEPPGAVSKLGDDGIGDSFGHFEKTAPQGYALAFSVCYVLYLFLCATTRGIVNSHKNNKEVALCVNCDTPVLGVPIASFGVSGALYTGNKRSQRPANPMR